MVAPHSISRCLPSHAVARHTRHTSKTSRSAGTSTIKDGRWRADTRRAGLSIPISARLRAQRRRETVTEGGWAGLPDELVAKVLEMLQAAGRTEPRARLWVL